MSAGDFDDNSPRGAVPVRRAFSAFLPPSSLFSGPVSASVLDAHYQLPDDELSFENDGVSAEMSSPAQAYSKRQQVKTIRRCDGTEDFRPLTGATALKQKESPFNGNLNNLSPSSRLMAATGLPGFGDNEAHGKILPCHRVTEDGLMRIKPQTVRMLSSFFVNDC
jgi:M-phase inducer tyrosine phosphatase